MTIEVNIWSTKSYKPLTKVCKSFSKQKNLVSKILVQPQLKLKFGRPKYRPKFEYFDPTHLNQDQMAKIQS